MPTPTLMARRIKAYWHLAGLTQRDLSRRCKIARSTLAAVECGSRRGFGIQSLMKLASALNVSVEALAKPDAPEPVA